MYLFTQHFHMCWMWHKVNGVIWSFPSVCHTKAKEPSLPNYLPIVRGRKVVFKPFPRMLALCEMPAALSRNQIWGTVFISYDDNTTSTSSMPVYKLTASCTITVQYCIQYILTFIDKGESLQLMCWSVIP